MVVNRHVAVAGTGWFNRARAFHRFVDHDHTVGGRHSAGDNLTADTLIARWNFKNLFLIILN